MVDPVSLALTFAKLAIDNGKLSEFFYQFTVFQCYLGVKIVEDCSVKEILTEKQRGGQYDRVTSVVTSQGDIKCDVFINCTGLVRLCLAETFHFIDNSRHF